MSKVLKFQTVNAYNDHMFHMIKANVGVCLMRLKALDTDIKFKYIQQLDAIQKDLNQDTDSFKRLLSSLLADILSDCHQHLGKSEVDVVVNGLFKHFNLRILQ